MPGPRKMIRERHRAWRELRVPTHGILELTPRCNLDCKMCYIHLNPDQMGQRREMTTVQWIDALKEAVDMGLVRVALSGGECMLHPGFWDIYTFLREHGVLTLVKTNGLLLTEENVARFKELPPTGIRVSLYGIDNASYARCTGHPVFDRVVENIKRVQKAGILIDLALTVSRYCYDDVIPILDFGRANGLYVNMDFDIIDAREDTGRHLDDYGLSAEEMVEKKKELVLRGHGKLLENPPITELPPLLPDAPNYRGVRCSAGKETFAIHWDGQMGACLNLNSPVYVQDLGFAAAWKAAQEAGAAHRAPVECAECPYLDICATCVLRREDPKNPGHCNPEICRRTIASYNAGLSDLKRRVSVPDAQFVSDDC